MLYDRERWPEHPAVFAMIVCYIAAGLLVAVWYRSPGMMAALGSTLFVQWAALLAVPYLAALAIRTRFSVRDARGQRVGVKVGWFTTWAKLREGVLSPRRLIDLVCLTVSLGFFFNAFSCWKYGMAAVRPFSADEPLSRLDIFIHGGRPAWVLLQPWVGHPWVTAAIDTTYETVWFATVVFMTLAMAWQPASAERTRFFVAFVLSWMVLGTGLAYLFPSAGPGYYHHFVPGPDPYQELISYLQATSDGHDLTAVHLRSALWLAESRGMSAAGAGIAAMPSMHVALPALFACATWADRRRLSLLFMLYTVVVLVSSVHLGWHYAVDGYAAILLILVVWRVSGILLRQWTPGSPGALSTRPSLRLEPVRIPFVRARDR